MFVHLEFQYESGVAAADLLVTFDKTRQIPVHRHMYLRIC
jgi:hypothetical protein